MVYVEDLGSFFEAPIDKVWKLSQAHQTDLEKIHPDMKDSRTETVSETSNIVSYESDMQGQTIKNKIKITILYPLGMAFEFLEGPMAGSKFFNYYIPKGNRTGVNVVGDFVSPGMSDEMLKQTVLSFFEHGFNEDVAYLKKMNP